MPLAEMERRLILAALEHTSQDVPRAAALLEINPSTIYRKLQGWRARGAPWALHRRPWQRYSGFQRSRRSSHSR